MKHSSLRWYYGGFIGIVGAVLAFQLIWLPAPFVMTPQLEWIEVVDWLYYSVLLIPCCWLIGSLLTLTSVQERKSRLSLLMNCLIIIGSLILIILILQPLQHIVLTLAILIVNVLFVAVELFRKASISKQLRFTVCYIVILLLLLCPTSYQVTYPAMTMNMSHYAKFVKKAEEKNALTDESTAAETKEATAGEPDNRGWIDGVLVFERPAFPIDWLFAKLLPQVELRKQAANEPSIRETYSQVAQMKNDTNLLAAALAWEYSGKGKAIVFEGAAVTAIIADSPADGVLQAGDIIQAINGHRINNQLALQQYMKENIKPGAQVTVELRRENNPLTVNLTTMAADQEPERAILGIVITNQYEIELEQELQLASYLLHAGGPSHGAMLTLALLNQLADYDITGGLHVAGTGTIEVDGSVGMVGGIPQKAYAVGRTDADVFFVPAAGVEAARSAAPNLNIVGVEKFEDIITWLQQHGGKAT